MTAPLEALGAPECGSHAGEGPEIKSWGGRRSGAGRKARPGGVLIWPRESGPRWYAVEVRPRMDDQVAAEVERLGYGALVPRVLGIDGRLRLALPGWIFGEWDVADAAWRRAAHVRGVRRILGLLPERPTPIPAVEMAWIIGQFGEGGAQRRPPERVEPLAVGSRVRVAVGLLEGWSGRVAWSNGRDALVEMGGRTARVAQAWLRAA